MVACKNGAESVKYEDQSLATVSAPKVNSPLSEILEKAESGDSDAQFELGARYDIGDGVHQNRREALRWFLKSAEAGNKYAQLKMGEAFWYGNGVSQDYVQAVKWFRKSATQGNYFARNYMRIAYSNGYGVPVNHEEASRWDDPYDPIYNPDIVRIKK